MTYTITELLTSRPQVVEQMSRLLTLGDSPVSIRLARPRTF